MDSSTATPFTHDLPDTPPLTPALVRFTVAGLRATLDAHRAGTLPAHRLARELRARVETLAGLGVPPRTGTRLRWLVRAVESTLESGPENGPDGQSAVERSGPELAGSLVRLRTLLDTLVPDGLTPDAPTPAGHTRAGHTPDAPVPAGHGPVGDGATRARRCAGGSL